LKHLPAGAPSRRASAKHAAKLKNLHGSRCAHEPRADFQACELRYDSLVRRHRSIRFFAPTVLGACALAGLSGAAAPAQPAPAQPAPAQAAPLRSAPLQPAPAASSATLAAPMSGPEIIQMLDETVDWYRTLGAQLKIANEPSDLLILSENRQIANQVMALAFDVARAGADLIAVGASAAAPPADSASAPGLVERQHKLDQQALLIQGEIDSTRQTLAAAPRKAQAALQAKLGELGGELALVNVKKDILGNIAGVASEDGDGAAGALRSQIDAMAVALPTTTTAPAPAATPAAQHAPAASIANLLPAAVAESPAASRFGVWDVAADVFRLSEKMSAVDAVDRRTQALETYLGQIRARLVDQLRALSARGDALMAQADSADSAGLATLRQQLDATAGEFKQASPFLVPLSKQGPLLDQYRHSLKNWHDAIRTQYGDALKSLGIRAGILLLILGLVFAVGRLWHRAVLKYVQDTRRRYQLLLVRRIALWTLVVIIIGFTFASELSSVATFAGLITAGVAVAMQSVLVSIVGYFFLIGKYGIRVGDRVQIGEVNGQIIEIGLVRMYLMELAGQGSFGPTGRVVAFPNSVAFQVTSGLFKQIPGVSFGWHDITLSLPAGVDYASTKQKLLAAANEALADYREEIERQTRELQRTTMSSAAGAAEPTVQLSYSAKGVDARVRYPVHLPHAAEIDERMSRALLQVVSGLSPAAPAAASAPA
jgi:small-conductance mechanosensitive channel